MNTTVAHENNRATASFQAGREARRKGDIVAAIAHFRAAIELQPDHIPAHNNLANALHAAGDVDAALDIARQTVALAPDRAVLHNNLGGMLQLKGELDAAIAAYQRALELQPDFFLAHLNLGKALVAQEAWESALAAFDRALRLQSTSAETHLERGQVLTRLNRHDDALTAYEHALELAPDMPRAHLYQSVTLIELNHYHLALLALDRALALDPTSAVAWYNRGLALSRLKRCQEGLHANLEAIARQPDYADAHWHVGLNALLLGDFDQGWNHYEWRWKRTGADRKRYADHPLWTGQDVAGKTVLLHAEQGMGDTLQFCRYAPMVAARGGRVLLEVYPAVAALCSGLSGVAEVLPQSQDDGAVEFDYHAPLLSLPHIFGPTLDAIPTAVPYLRAPLRRRQFWQERLGPRTKPRIGLVWSGNPKHRLDHERSIPLEHLAPLLTPEFQWISLQREVRDRDSASMERFGLTHFGEKLRDFADTAAVIEQLDLVISVDTAVAHLAGAMGMSVWIMLHYNPDWRWMLDRADSPWYPSVRLFRQPIRNDWSSVITTIGNLLRASLQPTVISPPKDNA